VSDFSPSGVAPTKPAMRTVLLAARRAVPAAERRRRDTAIAAALAPLVRGRAVAGFVPTAGEPSAFASFLDAESLLLPVLRTDLDLDWGTFTGAEALLAGRYGLREPAGVRLGVEAVLGVSLLVVPALAVGRDGARLGRGGGSYDRVLARAGGTVPTLAVVDAEEVLDRLPVEPHDRLVDGYVTPRGVTWLRAAP
jgi:5-formyltetrahydrofolate cyclo-ligase